MGMRSSTRWLRRASARFEGRLLGVPDILA
jgi:hypothetical protein